MTSERLEADQYAEDIKWLLSSKQGRRIVWRLLAATGIHRNSFTGNSTTFFREGERNVGLRFTRDFMAAAAEEYRIMWTENARTEDFDVRDANGRAEESPPWVFDE